MSATATGTGRAGSRADVGGRGTDLVRCMQAVAYYRATTDPIARQETNWRQSAVGSMKTLSITARELLSMAERK